MTDPRSVPWTTRLAALAFALGLATVWGTVLQTQFNLQALTPFVEIPPGTRVATTLQDLVGYGPTHLALVAAAWLPALPLAWRCARRWPRLRTPLYAVAAGVGLVVAIRAADHFAPMPVLIDATRSAGGLLAIAVGSAAGGALFALLTRRRLPVTPAGRAG